MIRTIDIRLNAAHPELPLPEATTYQGAPSTAFLRGVPKDCGAWKITAVSVAVTFPDNSTTTRAAVLSAGDVWVATIPGCATSGRTTSGLRILADGIDENGDAVTGFVLGVADLAVATFDIAPAPGVTSYALHYFDNVPNPPHKGDVAPINGVLMLYNGTAWEAFADLTNCATKADVTLNLRGPNHDGFSAWELTSYPSGIVEIESFSVTEVEVEGATDVYTLSVSGQYDDGVEIVNFIDVSSDRTQGTSTSCTFIDVAGPWGGSGSFVIARTALSGYQLGSQADKPLALEAEAEALRQGKLDKTAVVAPSTVSSASGKAADAKETGDALTVRPTKAQIDAGWWSDWTVYRDGVDVTAQVPQPRWSEIDNTWVVIQTIGPTPELTITTTAGESRDDSALAWEGEQAGVTVTYTATRHRVAAPVPTKPEDIGAQGALSAQQLANIAAVPNKAAASDLPYAISESIPLTVTNGAASMTLANRTHNVATVAAPGTGNTTTITLTLPAIVSGKSRGMFFNLTAGTQASDAGDISIVIVEPSGATAQIEFGGTEDVGIGKNEILISENAAPTTSGNTTTTHWLVTVRHEDFVS